MSAVLRKALLSGSLGLLVTGAQAEVLVESAWVREVPPVSEHSAAYMRLVNTGEQERRLVAAETSGFSRVEIHESIERDGVARMEHRDAIVIPAGGEAILQPAGYHLMLMRRTGEAPRAGDDIQLELVFADGERMTVMAEVSRHGPDGEAGEHHRDHDHDGHGHGH